MLYSKRRALYLLALDSLPSNLRWHVESYVTDRYDPDLETIMMAGISAYYCYPDLSEKVFDYLESFGLLNPLVNLDTLSMEASRYAPTVGLFYLIGAAYVVLPNHCEEFFNSYAYRTSAVIHNGCKMSKLMAYLDADGIASFVDIMDEIDDAMHTGDMTQVMDSVKDADIYICLRRCIDIHDSGRLINNINLADMTVSSSGLSGIAKDIQPLRYVSPVDSSSYMRILGVPISHAELNLSIEDNVFGVYTRVLKQCRMFRKEDMYELDMYKMHMYAAGLLFAHKDELSKENFYGSLVLLAEALKSSTNNHCILYYAADMDQACYFANMAETQEQFIHAASFVFKLH